MLELLVSLRRTRGEGAVGGAVKTDKKVGDVICAKVSPAIWGRMEHKNFLIVKYENPDLERKVTANDGVLSLPFSKHDTEGNMVTRSEHKVNVSSLVSRNAIALDKIPNKPKQKIHAILERELV